MALFYVSLSLVYTKPRLRCDQCDRESLIKFWSLAQVAAVRYFDRSLRLHQTSIATESLLKTKKYCNLITTTLIGLNRVSMESHLVYALRAYKRFH